MLRDGGEYMLAASRIFPFIDLEAYIVGGIAGLALCLNR